MRLMKIGRPRPMYSVDEFEVADCPLQQAEFSVDMIAVDPPWRQANLSYWSHKCGMEQVWATFVSDLSRHFVGRKAVYIKCGAPEAVEWVRELHASGLQVVEQWSTSYYAGRNMQILAVDKSRDWPLLECRPEVSTEATNVVARWARKCGIQTVADPCLGLGKMLAKFRAVGMRVAGCELSTHRTVKAVGRLERTKVKHVD